MGDDNTTTFGVPISVGKGTVTVAGRFRAISSETKRSLNQLISESSVDGALGVYLINEFGKVIAVDASGTGAVTQTTFPIGNYFISDVDSQGFNTNNLFNYSWTFRADWSDFFEITTPDFDILVK